MRYLAYVLTFVTYLFMHTLRTGYSFSKPYFKSQFQFSNTFLAVLDSSIYFSMGIGFLLRYFFLQRNNMIFSFFIAGLIFGISFILFSLLSITDIMNTANAPFISMLLMIFYGFFQMHCWPVSLIIVNDYFTNEEDGALIGFWTSAGSAGNIIGLIIPSVLIINAHMPWQVPQFIMTFALLTGTCLTYFFVERKSKDKENGYLELQGNGKLDQMGCTEMMAGLKHFFTNLDNSLLLVSACIYKAIIYTFMLWLPAYIHSVGQEQSHQSALISIIFNFASIAGSSLLGKLYESGVRKKGNQYCILYTLPIIALISIGGLIFLVQMTSYSFPIFATIVFIEGFFAASIFNLLTGNQMIKISQNSSNSLDFYTTLTFGLASLAIGLSQLLVGIKMSLQDKQNQSYNSVFIVLLALSILGFITLTIRSWHIGRAIVAQQ